jgi:putative ABC transport system permease protein
MVDRLYVTAARRPFFDLLPLSHGQSIAGIPGVRRVSHELYASGSYRDPKNTFAVLAIDPKLDFRTYPEESVPESSLREMDESKTSAIVGKELMERYGWRIGERIPITISSPGLPRGKLSLEFDIVGAYDVPGNEFPPNTFYINYDYINNLKISQSDLASIFIVVVTDKSRLNNIGNLIDDAFRNSPNETLTQSERLFFQSMVKQVGDISLIVRMIISAVLFTIILLVVNSTALSYRSRIREFAILKAVGFRDRKIFWLIVSEALFLVVSAALTGLLSSEVLGALSNFLAPQLVQITGNIRLDSLTVIEGTFAACFIAFLCSLPSAIHSRRLTVAEALRTG